MECKNYIYGERKMSDWDLIQKIFLEAVQSLIERLPNDLDHRLTFENQKLSFWVQACPGFDSKIYVTKDTISTSVDNDYCHLPCDFESGITLTVTFTFQYFESLLTSKSRLCRWLNNDVIYACIVDQWDGKQWVNTQGKPPSSLRNSDRQFVANDLVLSSVKSENNLNFSSILNCERE
tara:strand:+ start:4547 stop:5080 length:534 start_codon:yes stop_codon:yes gene_type:complete